MSHARWRVAVTRDDKADDSVAAALQAAGFEAVSVPVLVEGPAPDPEQLIRVARDLESFDWVICASVRAVRAISAARGSRWPQQPRTAAVGLVTAAAMREAGAAEPIVADTFTAEALWKKLRSVDAWKGRRVLITTVAGGRRELIDGLRKSGAQVTEVEPYSMTPRDPETIRDEWEQEDPDAVILGSAETARHLIEAVGVEQLCDLAAVVPIGPTTARALRAWGIRADPPLRATYADAIERLKLILPP